LGMELTDFREPRAPPGPHLIRRDKHPPVGLDFAHPMNHTFAQ